MQPWEFVYMEKYPTKSEAIKRENFIKGQKSSHFIIRFLSGSSAG
ncbi:GIY-YIG nuclease family protein [Aquiflexum sp. AIY15W]|nr:GIY-YIG nuclease family protein [Cognataquiflexum rubidum]